MTDKKQRPLSQIQAGQSGIIKEIQGGQGMVKRLASLGIRDGLRITKISSMIMRGPVTIKAGNSQVAVGFGIAKKILVELE